MPCRTSADHLPGIQVEFSPSLSFVDHSPQGCILLPASMNFSVACAPGITFFPECSLTCSILLTGWLSFAAFLVLSSSEQPES